MSPPEVWGPAVWTLFHTLIEKMNPDAYPYVIDSTFRTIVSICKYLPCPECSNDSSNFLAKLNVKNYKTKNEFKNMLYLFHNYVNAKKRKPLYNYSHMKKYAEYNLIHVINNFISKYNTKGNMKLLTESFQRSFVIKNFITWFKYNSKAFIQPKNIKIEELVIVENTIKPKIEPVIVQNTIEPEIEEPVIVENTIEPEIKPVIVENTIEQEIEEPVIVENTIDQDITVKKKKRKGKK